jgi:hypothetical protein
VKAHSLNLIRAKVKAVKAFQAKAVFLLIALKACRLIVLRVYRVTVACPPIAHKAFQA